MVGYPPVPPGCCWAGELTCWNPAGMVTSVLAMLAGVGGSHVTLVTEAEVELCRGPPKVCVEPYIRTGRYVVGFTYRIQRARHHFSPTALP